MKCYLSACLSAALLVLVPAAVCTAQPRALPKRDVRPVDDPDWMFEVLERVREKYGLPAISASVIIGDRVVAASAAGRRKVDDPTPVKRTDRFKIGSVSKPVTATLVGALVDTGVLSFDDTVEKMFPELADSMQPGYRKVTVEQLLSHTSGMPYAPSKEESHDRFKDLKEAVKNRYRYVKNALADKPVAKPGEKYNYSGGHVIVAHYAERLTGKPVEELLEEHVYQKLSWSGKDHVNVTSGLDRLDGPWPHALTEGKVTAREPSGEHGKSRLPVGGVCCSMIDLGRLASAHLRGAQGKPALLKAETFKRLHQEQRDGVAMALFRSEVDWAKGLCLWHNGATGDWFCLMHVLPDENFATCVATNYGGKDCDQACQAVHLELVKRIPRLKEKLAREPQVPRRGERPAR